MIYNRVRRAIYRNITEAAQLEGIDKALIERGLKSGYYIYIPYSKLEDKYNNGEIDIPFTKILEYRNSPNITINGYIPK